MLSTRGTLLNLASAPRGNQPEIVREIIARRIIDPAGKGERDPERLSRAALAQLGLPESLSTRLSIRGVGGSVGAAELAERLSTTAWLAALARRPDPAKPPDRRSSSVAPNRTSQNGIGDGGLKPPRRPGGSSRSGGSTPLASRADMHTKQG